MSTGDGTGLRVMACGVRSFRQAVVVLAAAMLMSCAPVRQVPPADRAVNFGFESVTADAATLHAFAAELDRADVTRIAVSAGRPEFAAFPWDGHEQFVAPSAQNRDLVAAAIDVLGPGRAVTITVDMLAPATVDKDLGRAGRDTRGEASNEFLSVAEITGGEYAERAVDFVDTIAQRYKPEAIGITELMFDDFTFGEKDLESYRQFSGSDDWPRRGGGEIAVDDASIGRWRSEAVSGLVQRMAAAAHAHGVELHMDVRANFDDPVQGRPESGHDYRLLLEHADSLEVWAYVGLSGDGDGGGSTPDVTKLTDTLVDEFGGDQVRISVGLWGNGSDVLSADALRQALGDATRGGATAVSVTPASLLDAPHWAVLGTLWASPTH